MFAARSSMVFGFAFFACLGPGAPVAEAQQPAPLRLETVFPAQVPRGQSTLVNVAFTGRDLVVEAAEISPSAGVTVSGLKRATESQGVQWWEFTVDVAKDAAPGNRSLVLVMPMGRTLPITMSIPSHVPAISDLKIVPSPSQPAVELQFAAADESADLGDSPYVWFRLGCDEPVVGVVRGHVTGRDARSSVVHAIVPNPRTARGAAATGRCDVKVRATDSSGIESNTLNTSVEFKN